MKKVFTVGIIIFLTLFLGTVTVNASDQYGVVTNGGNAIRLDDGTIVQTTYTVKNIPDGVRVGVTFNSFGKCNGVSYCAPCEQAKRDGVDMSNAVVIQGRLE